MVPTLGLVLGGTEPPDAMLDLARLAEDLGFEEAWVTEDCYFTGAIAAAGAILGATRRIRVGTAVVSAFTRHPAILALEISTLSRLFPGRVIAGIGFGLPAWLEQMGVHPRGIRRPFADAVVSVQALLSGRTVSEGGDPFWLDDVSLNHPPQASVPTVLGVAGPRLLELSGEIADGTLLGLNSAPAYVRWARERIEVGRLRAGRAAPHRVTCMAFCSIAEQGSRARDAVRPRIAEYLSFGVNAATRQYGIDEPLAELIVDGGREHVERHMPEAWVSDLAVAGDGDECRSAIARLGAAGADAVALYPQPHERAEEVITKVARALLKPVRGHDST